MNRFDGWLFQRGESAGRKRSGRRLLLTMGLLVSVLSMATQSSPTSAAVGLMPSDWIVTCDTATNSVSVTPVNNNQYTLGQSVAINLFQSSTPVPSDVWGAITTISPSGVATVLLSDLQSNTGAPLGTGFTTNDKVWAVVLDDFTNQTYRLDSVTTAVVNGQRVCRPQAVNPDMPVGWEVECNVLSNSIRISSTDPNFLIPTTGSISLAQLGPTGQPTLVFSAPLSYSADASPGGGVASVSLLSLQRVIGAELFPASPTNWVVVLRSNGRDFIRVDATTTAIENSLRVCPPPVLKVNVVDEATGQVQRGAQVFAVRVQFCDVIEGNSFEVLSRGVLGTHVLSRGQMSPGLYWIGTAAPAGYASQWYDRASCDAATQILVRSDGTVEPPIGAIVSPDPNGAPTITVRLKAGQVAALTLRDSAGDPVSGACVTALTWKPDAVWGVFVGETCQSVGGVYRVPGIAVDLPITLQIRAPSGFRSQFVDANDFLGTAGFTVDVNGNFISQVPGRTIPREVTLRAAGTITGLLSGPQGPASPVCVSAIDADNGDFSGATCNGSDGRFSLGVEPNRRYRVRIDGTRAGLGVTFYGGSTWGSATLVVVGNGTTDLGEIALQSTASVPIEVRDTNGQPIARACVATWGDAGDGLYLQNTNTTCYTPNGNFLIGGLQAGESYKFNVYAPGFRSTWFQNSPDRAGAIPVTAPGAETLNMVLVPGSGFRVKVLNSAGTEVTACLTAFKPTIASQWGEYLFSTCHPTGDLVLSSLEPGTEVALRVNSFNGSASAGWLRREGPNVVPVDLGNRTTFLVPDVLEDLGEVRLNAAYIVAGQVKVADQSAAGVCAEAFSVGLGGSAGSLLGVGCTDTDGRYGIGGLPVGTPIRVRFSSPSQDVIPAWFNAGVPAGVADPTLATEITALRNDVNIDLTRGSSLQVDVVGETSPGVVQASGPVSDVCVSAIDSQGRWSGRACSDQSGIARIRSLPAGPYTLWLQSSNPLYRSGLATDNVGDPVGVSVPEMSQVTVTARTGRVVAGVVKLDGALTSDICVVAKAVEQAGSDGAADPTSCSDANGNYRLVLDPNRAYTFSVVDGQVLPRFVPRDLLESELEEILLVSSPVAEQMSALVGATDGQITQLDALFVSSATSDSVTLRWDTVLNGPYRVTAKIGNEVVFETQTDNKQLTILGLVQGPTYQIEVLSGVDSVGTVSVRANAEQEGPPLPPGKPSVDVDEKSVSVSWSPVSSSASPVQYVAYLFDALTDTIVAEVSTASLSAVFENLVGPATYVARVVAINTAGSSPLSSVSDVADIRVGSSPGQPQALEASAVPGGFEIDWLPPLDTGGATTLGYKVEVSPVVQSGLTQASALLTCSTTATTCTFTDLVANTTYQISVVAFSVYGESQPVSIERLFVGRSAPATPGNVLVVGGDGRATISWGAPFDGGSPIIEYKVTASPGGRTCTTSMTLRCTISRLMNGTSYTFSVVARNAVGSSDPGVSVPTLIAVPPSAPTRLSAKALSSTSVRVSWLPPRSNGGVAITGYQIRYSTNGGRNWTEWASTRSPSTVTDLPPGTVVIFNVRAVNATFEGATGTVRERTPSRGKSPPGRAT